jgi:hypothetical protein
MNFFVQISWKLLEYRLMYYHPDKVHPSWHDDLVILDSNYDQLEAEYKRLADELGVAKTVSDMVDFDFSRPSCQVVMKKLGKERINSKNKENK